MQKPVCVVVGVGPGNGLALAKRWARAGHPVALLARSAEHLAKYESQIPGTKSFVCDATDPGSVRDAYHAVRQQLGPVDTLLYNAGSGIWGGLSDIEASAMERSFRVNALGLVLAAQHVVPEMVEAGQGTIGITGASAAWRGRPQTLAFAAAKAAQRSIAQSLARELGPKGIHVFYMVLDGVVNLPRTRLNMPDKPDDFFIQPEHVAEAAWGVAQQSPSAWSFELDLRPFGESW